MELLPLRPHQQRALDEVRAKIREGARRPVISSPTGSGKTLVATHMIHGALAKKKRINFVVSLLNLVDQSFERLVENSIDPSDIGVVQGNHEWRRPQAPIQIVSVQTAARRGWPQADFAIIDECFEGRTLVSTPSGAKRIQDVESGDEVFCAAGVGRVLMVLRRKSTTVEVKLSNGNVIHVTENHPFFTDRGWVVASALERGSRLYCQEDVRSLWEGVRSEGDRHADASGKRMDQGSILLNILLQEAGERHVDSWRDRQDESDIEGEEASAACARRQREGTDWSARSALESAWRGMGVRGGRSNEDGAGQRVPDLLQVGSSASVEQDWNRGGRRVAQREKEEVGREEKRFPRPIRVESVSRAKREGAVPVYNLHVSGHPSYFADGVLVHNCHLQFEAVNKYMDADPSRLFIGLSATPWAKGMGRRWDSLIVPTSIEELTKENLLAPIRAFAPSKPDLSDVKIVAGDYHNGQLSEKMSGSAIVGDVVETWLDKAEDRPTLVFAVDRAHANILQKQFESVGVSAAYVDCDTEREERKEIAKRFHAGDIRVICSIGTMLVGVDLDIRCISFCRPTKSDMLWVQAIGRGLRIAKGKDHCLLLDHSGTALRLGLPADIRHETLSGAAGGHNVVEMERKAPLPKECPKCSCLIPIRAPECPQCGYVPKRFSSVRVEEGELVELGLAAKLQRSKQAKENRELSWEEKALFYAELRGYAIEMHYKEGWAANKYKSRTGVWPNDPRVRYAEVVRPGMATRKWIRAQQIRWAMSQKKRSADEIVKDSLASIGE
jgi:superfamily II DNA or RNA helicase